MQPGERIIQLAEYDDKEGYSHHKNVYFKIAYEEWRSY